MQSRSSAALSSSVTRWPELGRLRRLRPSCLAMLTTLGATSGNLDQFGVEFGTGEADDSRENNCSKHPATLLATTPRKVIPDEPGEHRSCPGVARKLFLELSALPNSGTHSSLRASGANVCQIWPNYDQVRTKVVDSVQVSAKYSANVVRIGHQACGGDAAGPRNLISEMQRSLGGLLEWGRRDMLTDGGQLGLQQRKCMSKPRSRKSCGAARVPELTPPPPHATSPHHPYTRPPTSAGP